MRVHLVFAHPVETSYGAALKAVAVAALEPRHQVDLLDLYAENFDPVMSRAEWLGYQNSPTNQIPVAPCVQRLLTAEALVVCFPAWTFGPPAILKGWLDRLLLPGVAFHIQPDGSVTGGLTNLRKVAGIVTYGQTRWNAFLMGDYSRKIVRRTFRRSSELQRPPLFLAHYAMNVSTPTSRAAFLARVSAEMARF